MSRFPRGKTLFWARRRRAGGANRPGLPNLKSPLNKVRAQNYLTSHVSHFEVLKAPRARDTRFSRHFGNLRCVPKRLLKVTTDFLQWPIFMRFNANSTGLQYPCRVCSSRSTLSTWSQSASRNNKWTTLLIELSVDEGSICSLPNPIHFTCYTLQRKM